ncbi:MAG: hypothetical protein D6767_06020 [Candidatus Hydrogenedentota bacterium]|nr:MAG: hypothetical protein D6767_06020 [Candidatus Hydrogenedentota bacterium]
MDYEFSKKQPFHSVEGWYSLEYPRLWEMEVIENIPAFFNPFGGYGSLQVFAVKMGALANSGNLIENHPFLKGESLTEKMQLFLERQDQFIPKDSLQLTEKRHKEGDSTYIVATEYRIENRFYMACMMQRSNIFLLSLYNCEGLPDKAEARAVGEILKSIEIHKQ